MLQRAVTYPRQLSAQNGNQKDNNDNSKNNTKMRTFTASFHAIPTTANII
jgi:hypothetical protein